MGERIGEIESLAKKYPNVPLEAILKNDLLRLGLAFTDSALKACEGSCTKSYRLFTYDKVKFSDMTQEEPFKVPEALKFFGGPYNLHKSIVQVRINPDSAYRIDVIEGQVVLCENGTTIANVILPPAPKYYSKASLREKNIRKLWLGLEPRRSLLPSTLPVNTGVRKRNASSAT